MAEVTAHSTLDQLGQEDGPHGSLRKHVTRPRMLFAGALTVTLAAGLAGGLLLSRGSGEDAGTTTPNGDKGVAAGAPFPGSSAESNTTPTQSSGGFNNGAKVVLKCTGLKMEEAKDDEARTGAKGLFKVTPVVEVVSGDPSSPYLYTLLGTDTGHNVVAQGVGSFTVDSSNNAEFPVIVLADTAGTKYGPGDPSQLQDPFGDNIPDAQLFDCPVVGYPNS